MRLCKFKSDGLGGLSGVSSSMGLGNEKHITYNKSHLLLFSMFLTVLNNTYASNVCFLSLTMSLQRSNELYRNIRFPYKRAFLSYKNDSFNRVLILSVVSCYIILWLSIILLQSGDIVNPGPDSVESSADSSDTLESTSLELLANHLSILYLNIQSIVPKMDIVRSEAKAYGVSRLLWKLVETWYPQWYHTDWKLYAAFQSRQGRSSWWRCRDIRQRLLLL